MEQGFFIGPIRQALTAEVGDLAWVAYQNQVAFDSRAPELLAARDKQETANLTRAIG